MLSAKAVCVGREQRQGKKADTTCLNARTPHNYRKVFESVCFPCLGSENRCGPRHNKVVKTASAGQRPTADCLGGQPDDQDVAQPRVPVPDQNAICAGPLGLDHDRVRSMNVTVNQRSPEDVADGGKRSRGHRERHSQGSGASPPVRRGGNSATPGSKGSANVVTDPLFDRYSAATAGRCVRAASRALHFDSAAIRITTPSASMMIDRMPLRRL
jgi:hypothetical protein